MPKFDPTASRRQFAAGLVIAATAPFPAIAKEAGGMTYSTIHDLAETLVAQGEVPSMVVAIGHRGLPPSFISAGQQELGAGPPAGPDTLYRIYSMTKPVTGIAIMLLVEDGKLTLDTPVAEIFPQYAELTVLTDPENSLETRPAERPLLIRHLLTHSSGFSYSSGVPGPLKPVYAGTAETARAPQEEEAKRPPNLIAFAEAVAKIPLLFEPGTSWNYGISLDIAGAVVEKVSGMPFEAFLEQRLFGPLGMEDTFFTVPADKLSRLVANYQRSDNGLQLIETGQDSLWANPPRFPVGGSGLVSSARDYASFMAMLLNEGELAGRRVMTAETARAAMSDMMEPGVMEKLQSDHSGYGAGGRVVVTPAACGEAPGTFGWSGAASTYAFVDRASGFYTVLMTQVMGWYPNPMHDEFTRKLYREVGGV